METSNTMYYEEKIMECIDNKDDELTKAIKGDKKAFVNIMEKNKLNMYKIGRSILNCDYDIGDAMQETVIKAFNNIGNLKNANSFKSWLLKIMVNECHNIISNKKKLVVYEEVNCNSIHNDSYEVENEHVLEAIKTLDNQFREVVILYYYNDLSVKEISRTLDISQGTVKSRLSRARKKLFELLKGERE